MLGTDDIIQCNAINMNFKREIECLIQVSKSNYTYTVCFVISDFHRQIVLVLKRNVG